MRDLVHAYTLVTAPAIEPVTLAEAKAHARIDIDDDDAYVTTLIQAARQWIEEATGRCLITQTWRLDLDQWPIGSIEDDWSGVREGPITLLDAPFVTLKKSPCASIVSVATLDEDDASTTWAASNYYLAKRPNGYGRVVRKSGVSWPDIGVRASGAINITFTAGYGALASSVPFPLRQALMMLVAHWYETREPVIERGNPVALTVESLLAAYRVLRGA